jgi:subtilisin family serine protease
MDIVSMSIWVSAGAAPDEPPIPEIERAAQYCVAAGCLVVGIVGNSGSYPNHWVANHGRCPSVMGIGAVDEGKNWWAHDFYNVNHGGSAYGPPELPDNQAVELVAPGEYVLCAGRNPGEIVPYEGTSQACPHVAGAAALVKSINPQMKPAEIRQRLNATAQKLAVARRDDKLGFGLVDCQSALANV